MYENVWKQNIFKQVKGYAVTDILCLENLNCAVVIFVNNIISRALLKKEVDMW